MFFPPGKKILFVFLAFFLTNCAGIKIQSDLHKVSGIIQKDTVWSGQILMTSDVIVLKSAQLTILPGTVIKIEKSSHSKVEPQFFSDEYELIIRGALKAKGTNNKRIIFNSSNENGAPGNWAGIIFENSSNNDNILKYCNISDAESAVKIINSSVQIKLCTFEKNIYGITVIASPRSVKLEKNIIRYNKFGIYSFFSSRPVIKSNIIEKNKEEGIFYTLDSEPLLDNNSIENNKYNIRIMSR